MTMRLADGSKAKLVSAEATGKIETVYNFEVQSDHTYFIGESGLWVHNTGCCGGISQRTIDDVRDNVNGPADYNGREIDINIDDGDIQHVLDGTIGTNNSVTGGHSTNSGTVTITSDVELGHGGVRRADIEVNGTPKNNGGGATGAQATLFPEAWDDARIGQELRSGLDNGIMSDPGRGGRLFVVSDSGVIINVDINLDTGSINTFFPSDRNFLGN